MRAEIKVVGQAVPADFAGDLRKLYVPRAPSPALGAVFAAAKRRGWTWQALGDAIGMSRERVRQLARDASPTSVLPVLIPDAPRWPEPVRPQWPQLTEEQVERLRDLRLRGDAAGSMSADHPAVVASRELNALLQSYLDAGYRLADLARALGVGKHTVRFRLGRAGYRSLPPSMRYGPGPINSGDKPDGGES